MGSQGAGAPARSIVYDDWLHALDEWERGAHLQHHDRLLRDLQSDQVGHRRQQRIRPIRRHKDGRRGRTSLILSKLVYVVLNLVAMLGALYKMSLMGLLPTTPSDWVSFLEVPPAAQFASG